MGIGGRFFILLSPASPLVHHRSLIRLSRRRLQKPLHLGFHPRSLGPSIRPKSSPFFPHNPSQQRCCHLHIQSAYSDYTNSTSVHHPQGLCYPWPEFSSLVHNLSAAGYFKSDLCSNLDEFAPAAQLPEEFIRAASACLAFARDKAKSLGLLSRKDIEVLVQNGMPFLFQNAEQSARRMWVFLESGGNNVSEADKADMVDLMKFVLSYSSNVVTSTETSSLSENVVVQSSVRNLLSELGKLHFSPLLSNPSVPAQTHFSHKHGRTQRPFGQNIEMKRGDWICARCNFMNFARNVKCLECEEARPMRQLSGGEWVCPQCDFYNYARNTVCFRCDCKRPGGISLGSSSTNVQRGLTYGTGSMADKVDLDSRLAANEEKAQRWFSKVSQLDSTSDMSSAITDEDFPEIMPLRKGVNRFVVSTRKTPLERRLANAEYQRNMRNDGNTNSQSLQTESANKTLDLKVSHGFDQILGSSSADSTSNNDNSGAAQYAAADSPLPTSGSVSPQSGRSRGNSSDYIPFVPLQADKFSRKSESSKMVGSQNISTDNYSIASNAGGRMEAISGNNYSKPSNQQSGMPVDLKESSFNGNELAENSEGWYERVVELHGVTEPTSAVSDDDYPETMPVRKGENKFVVSRKKDRSLTLPMYKKRVAVEQADDKNHVPFVPFPPDYFAKKEADLSFQANDGISTHMTEEKYPDKVYGDQAYGNSTQNYIHAHSSSNDGWSNVSPGEQTNKERINMTMNPSQPSAENNSKNRWSENSLEGSAVMEPDPLDMSEEAKAERWFQRVAQIKDISELSQIPDEDFPSIMPMRKGVNRFVVSKRKTPLERRLTSQKYRRDLPVVGSDPATNKKGNNNN